jgi:hypothetical protein
MRPYPTEAFRNSETLFEALRDELSNRRAHELDHAQLEELIDERGTELLNALEQDHLVLRAMEEEQEARRGADGELRTERRASSRELEGLFGRVTVYRLALTKRGVSGGLRPLDARLNLPPDGFSFGVRRLVAEGAASNSYEATLELVQRASGAKIAKRQAEELAVKASADFEAFYDSQPMASEEPSKLLVLSFDGKGVVMRPEGLRPETQRKARRSKPKMRHRTGSGEKPNRKRMAEVATVYALPVVPRTPDDIFRELNRSGPYRPRPKPENKRVWASLEHSAAEVVQQAFDAALLRDETLSRHWVALVDGNPDQLRYIQAEARRTGVSVTIVLDFIHVLEYLWKAAWALQGKDRPEEAEAWVTERARRLLHGQASQVAAGMRRSATRRQLRGPRRKAVDTAADYLLNHKAFLRYDCYLADGLPIATGVIEGACRSLVRDRMDITGARWGLAGAEAVLKLRSLRASGDFDAYWAFHQRRELERNHLDLYDDAELVELREAA